ncbi:MAG: carbonic anhydrase/acetyltransferase [Isosphaeraceae bacterium]
MDRANPRPGRTYRPEVDAFEARLLLSAGVGPGRMGSGVLKHSPGYQAIRPNTPVLPFGAPTSVATFLDPSARIFNGEKVLVGQRTYVGPYATLDAHAGAIKIGGGSAVMDNAAVAPGARGVISIGDFVLIGPGAEVRGESAVGAFGELDARPTGIGPNALIDGATIAPGAVVGALARVGPGVAVPAGVYVLPGANVTTTAEATDPALGKVAPLPTAIAGRVSLELTRASELAAGYTTLYQGQSATGPNAGVDSVTAPGIFNGNLTAVSGTSRQPGPSATTGINFEPNRSGPRFPSPHQGLVMGLFGHFRARITGDARFHDRAANVARNLGRSNAFRADQGQPLTFANAPSTGNQVTITSPLGGTVTTGGVTKTVGSIPVGKNFRADAGAVLLGGPGATYPVGDDVTIGAGAVVERSTLGAGAVIGPRAYVSGSTVAPGRIIPPGTLLIDDVVVGHIGW